MRSCTAFTSASVTARRSVPFGRYCRTSPFVCPVGPLSRECWGVGREEPGLQRLRHAGVARELPAVVRREYVYLKARSTSGTTAPLWPFPMIVSASRSPTRSLPSTSAGRSEMSTRPGMRPRPECRPPRQLGFLPRRRSSGNSSPPAFLSARRYPDVHWPTHRPAALQTQSPRYPLRTPALGQKPLDARPALRSHPPGDPGRPAAARLRLVCSENQK